MKPRQKAFQAFCDALIDLHYSRKKEALQNLHKAQDIFENKPGYLAVINHNIAYIKEYEFSLDNVKFYFGDELIPQVYYYTYVILIKLYYIRIPCLQFNI